MTTLVVHLVDKRLKAQEHTIRQRAGIVQIPPALTRARQEVNAERVRRAEPYVAKRPRAAVTAGGHNVRT